MPGSRRIGLVVPVVLSMVDSLAILSIVAEADAATLNAPPCCRRFPLL